MSDSFLDRPGARLAFDVAGPERARTVVAAHGLTSSRATEDASGIFDWPALADGFRVLRYDARGHGTSTGRPEPGDYAWPQLAEDLLVLLDHGSSPGPVEGLGVSMGVGTLLWAATRMPERFRRLVLVTPPTAWATRPAQAALYEASARFVEERGLEAFERGLARLPPHPILEAGGWTSRSGPDVREDLLPGILRGAARTDLPPEEQVAALPHEVLLLPWADDPGHPVSSAERLHALLPSSILEVARTPDDVRGWLPRIREFLTG